MEDNKVANYKKTAMFSDAYSANEIQALFHDSYKKEENPSTNCFFENEHLMSNIIKGLESM